MALSAKEKERLDKMSFASGGGFEDFMTGRRKATPAGSKFLFIGLGGKGSKTVAGIKTAVYKKIDCPKDKKKPDNFEYLIIDTDRNSIDQLVKAGYGEVGLSEAPQDMETCQLYDSVAAKKLKPENRHLLPANIKEWINPMINAELQGAGAGGIRQAGRYLLFGEEAFKRVENTLTLKLQKLHSQIIDSESEKLIVYIFAGVGGGTGSGTIIDIPYIVREICNNNHWDVKIYAYIFLPDAYSKEATGAHLRYNSYAALKEIDTLMNIGQMGGAAQFRAEYVPGFSVVSSERIFDSCVLVSGKKNTGLVADPDKFTRNVVVDNIVNLVADNRSQQNGFFLVNSFLDNSPSDITNAVGELPNTVPRNAYYQYLVIGTGEIILPMEQIMAYLAQGTMRKLESAWDKHPGQMDVDNLLTEIHMLPEEQAGAIESQSTVMPFQYIKGLGGPIDKKNAEIISGSLFNAIKQMWMTRNVDLYNAWDIAKNKSLERIVGALDERYYRLFQDADAGIYFLRELFSARVIDGDKFNGICQRIRNEYVPSINGLIAGQQEMQRQIEMRMREIVSSLGGVMGGGMKRNALIEEYRELCVASLVCDNRIYLYENIVKDCMKQILEHLEHKLTALQKYIDVLAYMKEIVSANYQNVMEGKLKQAAYAGRLIDFSSTDEETLQVLHYLDAMLTGETAEGLATALEAKIIQTEGKWADSPDSVEEFEPMKVFVQFMEDRYKAVPNLTLEKFLQIKYGQDGFSTGIMALCNELKSKADVIFPVSPVLSLSSMASHKYVVIPNSATNMKTDLESYAKSNGASVAESSDANSIYWYNTIEGVPLFANSDIAYYEAVYEKNGISGMHLWENSTDNWKDLPALTMPKVWTNPDQNPREKNYLSQIQQDTQCYLQNGLIEFIEKKQTTELYMARCFRRNSPYAARETILEWCSGDYVLNSTKDENGLIQSGAALRKSLYRSLQEEMEEYIVNIPTVYMQVTANNLYEMLRLNVFLYKRLKETYELYKICEEAVAQENEKQMERLTRNKNIARFYDYARTGILQFREEAVVLERKNGEEEEVSYFEDYTTLDNRFYVYWAYQKMVGKYTEEELQDLDNYCTELNNEHSPEAREKYRALSDALIQNCEEVREALKKLDLKKALKDEGKEAMTAEYADFYTELLGKQKGKK